MRRGVWVGCERGVCGGGVRRGMRGVGCERGFEGGV